MKRRKCNIVILRNKLIAAIEYFIYNKVSGLVFAVVQVLKTDIPSFLDCMDAGKHLVAAARALFW